MSDSGNLVFKNSKESEQALELSTEQEFNKTQGKVFIFTIQRGNLKNYLKSTYSKITTLKLKISLRQYPA